MRSSLIFCVPRDADAISLTIVPGVLAAVMVQIAPGTHIGVDHFHVDREQTSDNVDVSGLDLLAAAGGIIDRLGRKGDFGQGLAVDARVLKILGIAEQHSACAANDLQLTANLLAVGQGVEFGGNLRSLDAEVLGMDENHRICRIDEGVLIGFAVDFDRVLDMTGGQEFAGGGAAVRQI